MRTLRTSWTAGSNISSVSRVTVSLIGPGRAGLIDLRDAGQQGADADAVDDDQGTLGQLELSLIGPIAPLLITRRRSPAADLAAVRSTDDGAGTHGTTTMS